VSDLQRGKGFCHRYGFFVPDVDSSVPDDLPTEDRLLSLTSRPAGRAVIITAVGEVDMLTAPQLLMALRDALALPGGGPVVCDLTDVTFLASAGLSALTAAEDTAAACLTPLRVVVDHSRPVIMPLHIVGLDKVLALYETVADALLDQRKPPIG